MKALVTVRASLYWIERPALAPTVRMAQALTGAVASVRRWVRRHGDRVRCAAAVLAVVVLAGLQSALIWHGMAGERIGLNQPSHASSTHTTLVGVHHHHLRRDVSSSKVVAASAPVRPAATTPAPAPTMSGTTLAVALIALTTALAFLAARFLLMRRPPAHEPVQGPADCEMGVQDPEVRDSAAGDAQQAMPLPGTETRASEAVEDVTLADDDSEDAAEHTHDAIGFSPKPGNDTATASGTSVDDRTASRAVGGRQPDSAPRVLFDRRLTQRVPFESNARLQWDDHDIAGTTVDLGMSGIRCRLPGDLPPTAAPDVGTTVQVTLRLNGALGVFQARVQWGHIDNDAPVIGLKFQRLQPSHQALLQSVVLQAAA